MVRFADDIAIKTSLHDILKQSDGLKEVQYKDN